jgi:hypothetical protein
MFRAISNKYPIKLTRNGYMWRKTMVVRLQSWSRWEYRGQIFFIKSNNMIIFIVLLPTETTEIIVSKIRYCIS